MGTIKSKDASGSPCNNANDFDKINYLTDQMIKDPHYLYIMRYPDFHHIIDPINQHTISITDLQQVVTNLITADKETRTWVETLAKIHGIPKIPWVPSVLTLGIDPYTCHMTVVENEKEPDRQ